MMKERKPQWTDEENAASVEYVREQLEDIFEQIRQEKEEEQEQELGGETE